MNQARYWFPFIGPFDPCPPIRVKAYVVAPNLFIPFQPPGWPQFSPAEALRVGTLWPAFYSPYPIKAGVEGVHANVNAQSQSFK